MRVGLFDISIQSECVRRRRVSNQNRDVVQASTTQRDSLHQGMPDQYIFWVESDENRQGALSVSTTRLLKSVLPSECLWTGLRTVEGFNHEQTISELRKLYNDDDSMEDDDGCVLPSSVPEPIREMLSSTLAAQALGTMIWWVRHGHQ